MNNKMTYNWKEVQQAHIDGASWRKLQKTFGVTPRALQKARDRGDFASVRTNSEATILSHRSGERKTPEFGEEGRKAKSVRQSTHNSGGRCEWFEVAGQKVQGTWERDFAEELERRQIGWCKPRVNGDVLEYVIDGKTRSYTPDFHLTDTNTYIEVKGYWWGNDKAKMEAVMSQHPEVKILIVEKDQFNHFVKGGDIW